MFFNFFSVNFLRVQILKNYYRRDFTALEKNVQDLEKLDSAFATFYKLSFRQLLGGNVPVTEWEQLLESVPVKRKYLRKRILNGLIQRHLHDQNTEQAIQLYLEKCKTYGFQRADIFTAIGIFKLCLKQNKPAQADDFKNQLDQILSNHPLKDLAQLNFLEVYADMNKLSSSETPLWKRVFAMVIDSNANGRIKNRFLDLQKKYQMIQMNHTMLLDLRVSETEQSKALEQIENALIQKKPFAFIRLGDGESYGMQPHGMNKCVWKSDLQRRENKWWGSHLSDPLRKKMQAQFLETHYQCDMIGIPSPQRFVRDLKSLNEYFFDKLTPRYAIYRGLEVVMEQVVSDISKNKYFSNAMFVEHRCHQVLFTKENIEKLFSKATKVVIVSSHSKENLQIAFPTSVIEVVEIPSERKGKLSLPYQLEKIEDDLKSKTVSGSLVLVGAGFAGKSLLKTAKDYGAVALDVGAMVDYWVGQKTRGVADIV